MSQALSGIRIADFSWAVTGPETACYLADFGAEVIKIESADRPCYLRTTPPFKDQKPGINRSGLFAIYNKNKYGIGLNLKHSRGIEIAKKIVSISDVVIESFTPGTMSKLGLDYNVLRGVKSDIIMLSTNLQGQSGPHARHPGYGMQLVSLVGLNNLIGWADRDPPMIYGAYTDYFIPSFAATAILAALDHRERTGQGEYLDLSQYECGLQFLVPVILDYAVNQRISPRVGNSDIMACPHGVYPCHGDDRWCAIAVFTDEEWHCFCRVIGDPQWTKESRFATFQGRKENENSLDSLISEWTIKHSSEQIMLFMQKAGVYCGTVNNAEDMLNCEQLKERDAFWKMEHAEIGWHTYFAPPAILSRTPAEPRLPAPLLGQHNEYVICDILGLSDGEFVNLLTEGVVM